MSNTCYVIGHGAYSGANRYQKCRSAHLCVMLLVERGVAPGIARTKVNQAHTYPYPHTTMQTADGRDVIELVFKEELL